VALVGFQDDFRPAVHRWHTPSTGLETHAPVRIAKSSRRCVSLSIQPISNGRDYSWIDVVEKDGRYFHPVGNRWPVLPPNYIGFRYSGALQTVHHIDAYEIVGNLADRNPNWPVTDIDQFVYTLGPAMKPTRAVRTGKIYRNGRVWCAIDTLLSGVCNTIGEARHQTASRLNGDLPAVE
jgi:hypothetical protein